MSVSFSARCPASRACGSAGRTHFLPRRLWEKGFTSGSRLYSECFCEDRESYAANTGLVIFMASLSNRSVLPPVSTTSFAGATGIPAYSGCLTTYVFSRFSCQRGRFFQLKTGRNLRLISFDKMAQASQGKYSETVKEGKKKTLLNGFGPNKVIFKKSV